MEPTEPTAVTYHGIVAGTNATEHQVWVHRPGKPPRPLNPRLGVRNHSPTGLSWGYLGSGCAQTALAICIDVVGVRRSLPIYQRYKSLHIATKSQSCDWTMTEAEVLAQIKALENS